jgi:lactoylglutathione lyase
MRIGSNDAKLGFVQHETASSHGFEYEHLSRKKNPPSFEIGLVTPNVEAAFKKAIEAGAIAMAEPSTKPWGQVVSYVRDCNGFLVEICSPIG